MWQISFAFHEKKIQIQQKNVFPTISKPSTYKNNYTFYFYFVVQLNMVMLLQKVIK